MTKVGELLFFLREKAERLLIDAETDIRLLSRLPSAKLGAELKLQEAYLGLRRSVQTLQRAKEVPEVVIAELQVDVQRLADLLEKVKKINVQQSNIEKVKKVMLDDLEAARETLKLVESGLVEFITRRDLASKRKK